MADYTLDDRWRENRTVWIDYWKTFTIERFGTLLALIAVIVAVSGYINQHGGIINLTNILGDFYANVSSELISIVITVLVLERLNARRQNDLELTRLKALLASNEAVVTKIAVAELKAKGWLSNGALERAVLMYANLEGTDLSDVNLNGGDLRVANLKGSYLPFANLAGAELEFANLEGATLHSANLKSATLLSANLQGTDLSNANLAGAEMMGANLAGADLQFAKLEGAILHFANLKGADLEYNNLEGANLHSANLEGVNLERTLIRHANMYDVKCDDNTILGDGETWTADVDWSKFGAVEIEDLTEWQAYRKVHGLDKDND